MVKAVIFDFDGLIVDTESMWFEAFKETMAEYGCDLRLEDFVVSVGTTDDLLFERLAAIAQKPFERADIERKTRELYQKKIPELRLRDGVIDYLQTAKALNLKIGLASSSSREWVQSFLHRFAIAEFFDVIKTADDVENVKPNPELYLRAIRELGVEAHEALAFEDSQHGLTAAVQAGLSCIIVPNRVTSFLEFAGHLHRLSSMADVPLPDVLTLAAQKQNRI
jgi:putative hydrolase of the HAD superfamily